MIDNARVREALEALQELDKVLPAGGWLHVVTDDWNIEDPFLEACLRDAEDKMTAIERRCYDLLIGLSVEERASALALRDGFWSPEDQACGAS